MTKRAFSFLELVVVVLIIGFITAAITKGISIIDSARLATARKITINSKINEIDGIIAWYETSLPESLEASQTTDNAQISAWYDISSPAAIAERKNKLSRTASSDVVYRVDGINKVPAIQFTSSGKLTLSSFYQGLSSQYSVFAVLSPSLAISGSMVFVDSYSSGSSNYVALQSSNLVLTSGSSISFSQSFSQSQNYIIGAYFSASNSVGFVNSTTKISTAQSLTINGLTGLTVGTDKAGSNAFSGLISEIIIFNRILSEEERRIVIRYLGNKYKIRIP